MGENAQKQKIKEKVKGIGPVKLVILLIFVAATVCSLVFHDFFYG